MAGVDFVCIAVLAEGFGDGPIEPGEWLRERLALAAKHSQAAKFSANHSDTAGRIHFADVDSAAVDQLPRCVAATERSSPAFPVVRCLRGSMVCRGQVCGPRP